MEEGPILQVGSWSLACAIIVVDTYLVYNIQAMRIQRLLCDTFKLVFLEGPLTTTAGAGILPVFDGCGPFHRWFRPGKDDNILPPLTRARVESALEFLESEHKAGVLGKVVGFMGFSQGAKLGAGLMWEQMMKGAESGFDFKFGVMCNAIAPPMCEIKPEDKVRRITMPTLHVVGEEDPWRDSSRKLFNEYFDTDFSKKLEFPVSHRLPTSEHETKQITDEIFRIWESCKKDEVEGVSGKDAVDVNAVKVAEVTA